MAITVEQKCNRCRRDIKVIVSDIKEAAALEELREKREANAKKIEEFLNSFEPAELPALVTLIREDGLDANGMAGFKLVTAPTLCDYKEEGKRSCTGRVKELVGALDQLEERKKRTPKPKASTVELTEAEVETKPE